MVAWQMSLLGMIDNSGSECLNESDLHPFQHALSASTDQYLESDCDEQLIIALAFQQPIKLHSLQLVGPTDGMLSSSYCCFFLGGGKISYPPAGDTSTFHNAFLGIISFV